MRMNISDIHKSSRELGKKLLTLLRRPSRGAFQNKAGVHRLNELTNPDKWNNADWLEIHQELETYSVDKHCFSKSKEFAYRKGWEWTQALYGLHRLGMITPEARALGVGAGHEPLLFYLSDRIREVVGTDLYGNADWSTQHGKEGSADILLDAAKFCARTFDATKLKFYTMDGANLAFEKNTFDFVWSLSSIEHFGGHDAARQSIREMARVTRPGGIVVVATELVLTPDINDHPDFFTADAFDKFVINASPHLSPVEPMNYELPGLEYLLDPIMVHLAGDVHRIRHHIVLNDGKFQWTSAIVFFRRVE